MSETDPSDLTRDALEREVEKLRGKVNELETDLDGRADEILGLTDRVQELEADIEADSGEMHEAIAALHEQAHGSSSVRFCMVEPCRSVESRFVGPAPLGMVMV